MGNNWRFEPLIRAGSKTVQQTLSGRRMLIEHDSSFHWSVIIVFQFNCW